MGDGEQPEDRPTRWLPPQAPGGRPPPHLGAPAPPPVAPPGPAPPVAPYPLPPGSPRPPANDRAVLSLILGIGGFVAFLSAQFGLFFVFNLPPSIAAWVIGAQAKGKVDRGETTEMRGTAQAGMVLGIFGTVLGVLAVIGWALALTMSDDARRWVLER